MELEGQEEEEMTSLHPEAAAAVALLLLVVMVAIHLREQLVLALEEAWRRLGRDRTAAISPCTISTSTSISSSW